MLATQNPTAPHDLASAKTKSTLMEPDHKAPPIALDAEDQFMRDFLRDGVCIYKHSGDSGFVLTELSFLHSTSL